MTKKHQRFFVSQHYQDDTKYRLLIDKHSPPEQMKAPHWHPQIEINLPKNCDAQYYFVNKRITVKNGQFAIFWGALPHKLDSLNIKSQNNSHTIYLAYVPLEIFMSYQLPRDLKQAVLNGNLLFQDKMIMDEHLFLQWLQDCQHDTRSRQVSKEVEARLNRLKGCAHINGIEHMDSMRALVYVRNIVEFISVNYSNANLRISDIGSAVGLHPNYMMSVFKQVMNIPLTAYLNRVRLSHACNTLVERQQPVEYIARDCGFGAMSRFYELFSYYLNMTPAKYRSQYQ